MRDAVICEGTVSFTLLIQWKTGGGGTLLWKALGRVFPSVQLGGGRWSWLYHASAFWCEEASSSSTKSTLCLKEGNCSKNYFWPASGWKIERPATWIPHEAFQLPAEKAEARSEKSVGKKRGQHWGKSWCKSPIIAAEYRSRQTWNTSYNLSLLKFSTTASS